MKYLTLTSFSESPRHLLTILDAEMLKNVVLHSVATAFANNVLPVPEKHIVKALKKMKRILILFVIFICQKVMLKVMGLCKVGPNSWHLCQKSFSLDMIVHSIQP